MLPEENRLPALCLDDLCCINWRHHNTICRLYRQGVRNGGGAYRQQVIFLGALLHVQPIEQRDTEEKDEKDERAE